MNGKSMSEKLGLGPERRELKFGSSFLNGRNTSFHTVKYDFKPASVDGTKQATVDVGSNAQITVTVPHLDGAGTAQTVFKGSQRPCQKECVLIIDKKTGEITLEKLSTCIQLKKTRQQSAKQQLQPQSSNSSNWSSNAAAAAAGGKKSSFSSQHQLEPPPVAAPAASTSTAPGHRRQRHGGGGGGGSSGKLPKNLSAPIPRHSPLHASPSYTTQSHKSPPNHKSPQSASTAGLSPSTIPGGSLPLISLDDISESHTSAPSNNCIAMDVTHSPLNSASPFRPGNEEGNRCAVDILTDSSSDSSSEDSTVSDSDSESNHSNNENAKFKSHNMNGHLNGVSSPSLQTLQMPDNFLSEDLQLSESGSESD